MVFDSTAIELRAWAVPALCALLDLHQDFDPPRHVALTAIRWSKRSCDIRLHYGTQNLSHVVRRSTEFAVSIHKNGIFLIRPVQTGNKEAEALGRFIVGEIHRQSRLWKEHLHAWNIGKPEHDTELICSFASGIAGLPADAASLRLHRRPAQRNRLHKVGMRAGSMSFELRPNGQFGTTWFIKDASGEQGGGRLLQVQDMRIAVQQRAVAKIWSRIKDAMHALIWLLLLPFDMGAHFLERAENEARRDFRS